MTVEKKRYAGMRTCIALLVGKQSEGEILLVILGEVYSLFPGRNSLQRIIAETPASAVFVQKPFLGADNLLVIQANAMGAVLA